jgi:hypothetical protein
MYFGAALRSFFSFREFKASRKRYHLAFAGTDPALKYLNRPEERETRFDSLGRIGVYEKPLTLLFSTGDFAARP